MGIIYMITCDINNKIYVGQTTRTLEKRWKEHKYLAKMIVRLSTGELSNDDLLCFEWARSKPLYIEMALYGAGHFTIDYLEKDVKDNDLRDAEAYWIKDLDCLIPDGYNKAPRGGHNDREESIQKLIATKLARLDDNRHPHLQCLPPKLTYCEKHDAIILVGHEHCSYKMFKFATYGGLEATRAEVIKFVKEIETTQVKYSRSKKDESLKPYPGLKETKKGYKLEKYINGAKYSAGFESKQYSREELKAQALAYYDTHITPIVLQNNKKK